MRDPAKLPSPIANYLKAENDYYEQATAGLAPMHEALIKELRGRIAEEVESVPFISGTFKYKYRYIENAEHGIYVRTDLNGDHETILFDIDREAERFEYFDIGEIEHSPDHSKLLWSCDTNGSEYYTLYIRDIASGKDYDYCIENTDSVTWANDKTIFYTRLDSSHRALQVYKHILGSNPANDVLIFNEKDERFYCGVSTSLSQKFVFIHTSMNDQDEVWFIPIDDLNACPTLIQPRTEGLEYNVLDHQNDQFVICTNANEATDWKIVNAPISTPSINYWTDVITHQAGRMIEDVLVLHDWIVWVEMVNALPQIAYRNNHGDVQRIRFDEQAYDVGIYEGYEYRTHNILFYYSSPTTPTETYAFNLQSTKRNLVKQEVIPSGHNPKNYITRRFSVASHDGAQVPVTLLYRHDTAMDGTAPALLYGYGSYGASTYAEFDHTLFSLVDRGFVYAVAHVRGGEEKGCAWYEDAKLERKTNSFHDFIAVGDALVAQGICAADKVVSYGGSAGGLLVAASLNMRPDLFAGVIADVPYVDVLNTMLDSKLPGTPGEYSQWGNPSNSATAFDSIASYSPYDNIKAVAYPPLFVTAGVSDPRVTYWEPAKWVAKLRHMKTDNHVVLLRTNMQSGHFGKTGRFAELEDTARVYAFAMTVTNSNVTSL